jgi:hypothetical protein
VNPNEILSLKVYVAKTLSMLEIWFLLGFFDIMTHLLIHLVEELDVCGPVGARWCYPIEWYLGMLKHYVRNKVEPKVCIAMGYMYDEVLRFCIKYSSLYEHMQRKMWDLDEELANVGEVIQGKATTITLNNQELRLIDEYVLMNSIAIQTLIL